MESVLQERIATALQGRHGHRDTIAVVLDRWSELGRLLDILIEGAEAVQESLRQLPRPSTEQLKMGDAITDLLRSRSDGPSVPKLRARLADVGRRLDDVAHRVNRDTVNIGMVGVTKSGKSTLLRTISGLDEDVVPTSAYDPTTAAASEIYHVEGSFQARVRLHGWSSFRAEYLTPLHTAAGLVEPPPPSEQQFAAHRYPFATADGGISVDPYLDKLRIAQESFDSYRSLLLGPRELPLSREQLRPFVAYPLNESDRDRPYHAVRGVRIEVNFGTHAVRGLGLVDLPGSRERGLDAHRQFMRDLRNRVDLLLLVTRPADKDAFFTQADLDTLVAADEARGGVDMSDFVRIVVNPDLVAGKPDFLDNAVRKIHDGVRRYGVPVDVCDVNNPVDVQGTLLPNSLQHLATHLITMDKAAIDSAIELAQQVGDELVDVVEALTGHIRAWGEAAPDEQDALLVLAERKRDELALDLEKLATKYDENVGTGIMDSDLVDGIAAATAQARDWVARGLGRGSKEEWLAEKEGAFASGGARTKESEFARARGEINAIYGSIDMSLETAVHRLWQEIADILRGRLTTAIVPASGQPLAHMRELAAGRRAFRLAAALDQLLRLKVDYGSVVLRVTRPIIRLISWDERGTGPTRAAATAALIAEAAAQGAAAGIVNAVTGGQVSRATWWQTTTRSHPAPPPPHKAPTSPKHVPASDRAEGVYNELTALLEERIAKLESALQEEARNMPNVLAAAVDVFRDATVWTEKIELDYRKLCKKDASVIWPEKFSGREAQLVQDLATLVDHAEALRRAIDQTIPRA